MVHRTNVRQHTRKTPSGQRTNVVRHTRRLKPNLGRVGIPRSVRRQAKESDLTTQIIAYEQDSLGPKETMELFSKLVKNGQAWTLQGHYGRTATNLIKNGYLDKEGNIIKRGQQKKPKPSQVAPFMKQKLNEIDVHLLMRRLNAGKFTTEEALEQMPEEGWSLEKEQVVKGRDWLMNQWKTPTGEERKNNPFGLREEQALATFETIKLVDFYSPRGNYYYPYYRVESSKGGGFEYTIVGGEINILG